jgi:hypothetical protein
MARNQSWLVVATMETEHYTFRACGANFNTARDYLVGAWKEHWKQINQDPPFDRFSDLDEHYGVRLDRVYAGWAVRDDDVLAIKE